MEKIKLEIAGLTSGEMPGSYKLILGEVDGTKRIPIVIGAFEAQAIAIEIEKVTTYRPMTHDLIVSFSRVFGINMKEALIYNLKEGVFFSKLISEQNGEVHEIDSRTSDAVALAIRFRCPIVIYKNIFDEVASILDDDSDDIGASPAPSREAPPIKTSQKNKEDNMSKFSLDDLEKMLTEALSVEDYDKAASLRDEITKRNKK